MCVDSGIKRFNYQYKIISFLSRLVHLSNKKKTLASFSRVQLMFVSKSEKRNLSCAVIYVLIKREIAVGLIPFVKKPPSPQKKLRRESLFHIFPEERRVSVQVKQRGKSERRSGDIESTFRVGRIAFSETDIFTANKK